MGWEEGVGWGRGGGEKGSSWLPDYKAFEVKLHCQTYLPLWGSRSHLLLYFAVRHRTSVLSMLCKQTTAC